MSLSPFCVSCLPVQQDPVGGFLHTNELRNLTSFVCGEYDITPASAHKTDRALQALSSRILMEFQDTVWEPMQAT